MTSSEGRERQRFTIDLPDQEAALALAGQGEIMLRRLSDLTGANLVLRGLQLFIEGRPSQMERAAGLVELLRPFWSCLLYTSPSPRDYAASRMPSSA